MRRAAEGPGALDLRDPADLTALGFIGLRDPLRPGVRGAAAQCRAAGVRILMLTGDHPTTARAIAADAGLPADPEDVLTGEQVADLDDGELDRRLEGVSVVARITPLDKLRIVELRAVLAAAPVAVVLGRLLGRGAAPRPPFALLPAVD